MDFLIIDDDPTFCEAACLLIESEGHYVECAATPESALDGLHVGRFDAALLDLHLGRHNGLTLLAEIVKLRPDMPVVMFSADGTVKTAVQALHNGAMDFLEKPFTREQFHMVVARIRRFSDLNRKISRLEEEMKEAHLQAPDVLIESDTPTMNALQDVLLRAAKCPTSVLLLGATGTGKRAAAHFVHAHSDFADKPFVTVHCPALSEDILKTQLFGHLRGSFPGALRDHWGAVKAADGGTLFLDEIGDLPAEMQQKLLRLLQDHAYERVGETISRFADVRVVAATNRDLRKAVASGTFLEELFYRLGAITVELPPLRERPADIIAFAEHYLRQCAARARRPITGFTPECLQILRDYAWPGNLHELHAAIERAVLLCNGAQISALDLPVEIRRAKPAAEGANYPAIGSRISLAELEELHIRHLLTHSANLSEAAQVLGIDQATLYRKRKRMGLRGKSRGTDDGLIADKHRSTAFPLHGEPAAQ